MEKEVKCPSGLKGRIRALKVEDEKLYADPQIIKNNRLFTEWAKRCWLETIEPGPYNFTNGTIDWDNKVLVGDVFFLFFELIKMKLGGIHYEFEFPCPACGHRIQRKVNLDEELFVKELSDEASTAFASGQAFTTNLPDGRIVTFRLLLSGDSGLIKQLEDTKDLTNSRAAMIVRLVEVQGIKFNTFWDKPPFVEGLDSSDADALEDAMEQIDCGIDTDIEMVCTNVKECRWEDIVQLPLSVNLFRKSDRSLTALRKKKEKRKQARLRVGTTNQD